MLMVADQARKGRAVECERLFEYMDKVFDVREQSDFMDRVKKRIRDFVETLASRLILLTYNGKSYDLPTLMADGFFKV